MKRLEVALLFAFCEIHAYCPSQWDLIRSRAHDIATESDESIAERHRKHPQIAAILEGVAPVDHAAAQCHSGVLYMCWELALGMGAI